MKRKNKIVQYLILGTILFLAAIVSESFAAGTPAGTVIQSRSRVTFTTASGVSVDTVYSAYVSITVKQVGSFNITPASNAVATGSDSVNVDYAATVTNSGNGTDVGRLSTASSKGWITQIFFDANGDGVLQSGEVSAGSIAQTGSLASDADYKIVVRVRVPRDEMLNGEKDTTSLTVKSNFDSTKLNNGKYITTVRTPMLPPGSGLTVNNPNPNAGTNVTYTYTYTNNGSVPVTGMSISNLFSASAFTFVSGTGSQGTFNGSANPVLWNIGSVAPGATITVTLTLQINSSNPPGTILSNYFSINYNVGTNNYTVGTNTQDVTVAGVLAPGVQVTAMWNSLTKEATDSAVYRFKVRNSGTVKDVIEMSTSSTRGFNWALYRDANNNSQLDGTDPQLTNTNGSGGVDVDSVAAGDSVRIFARAIIARQSNDQVKDSLSVKGSSSSDITKTSTTVVVTTINVPVVEITKNVFPVGDQPAGAVITYSITFENKGSASVSNFVLGDTTPSATNYVPNSVQVNGSSVLDNTGPLSITTNAGNTIIAVNIGTLSAGQTGSIEFKVKIK
ncbi:MAG: DUF11 domain-containing protein [Ignavibacteriales bacterium]|nr:DUF11 domain-containing protein [Ignavibacteriales bacterium]